MWNASERPAGADYDPTITDLHTRKLRYFIAVAEELHFSRAAARLFVAQQALSRQIRELEDELGVPLFVRSTRMVELTPAGAVFLEGARAALESLDDATAGAVRTHRAVTGCLRLGFFPGAMLELTEPVVQEFRSRYPEVTLDLHESAVADPSCGLRDGTSDLGIVRAPLDSDGIDLEAMVTEPVVVAMSPAHRLASRTEITVDEILDEPITLSRTDDAAYRAFWILDAFRDGTPPPAIVGTSSVTEEVQLVATGSAIAVTAAAAVRYAPHPGLRYLPITGAPRSTIALAWRSDVEPSPLAERFRACAREVRDRETATVRLIEHPVIPGPPR